MVTVKDTRKQHDDNSDGIVDYYTANIATAQDYSSFGALLENRQYGTAPRFTYNGKELDKETGWQNYGMREYLGGEVPVFASVDPLTKKYPWYSPYQFAGNTPIQAIDLDGAEEYHYVRTLDKNGESSLKLNGQKDIVDRVQIGWRTSTSGGNDGLIPVYKNVVNQRQTYVVDEMRTGYMDVNAGLNGARKVEYPVSTTYSSYKDAAENKNGKRDWGVIAFYSRVGAQNIYNEYKEHGGGGATERVQNTAETGSLVKIGAIEGDVMMFSSKVGKETVEGITNFAVKDGKLYLNQLHLQGSSAGNVGREALWNMARDLGKQYNVKEVIIQGGKRTTGRYKGQVPSPITIKVN